MNHSMKILTDFSRGKKSPSLFKKVTFLSGVLGTIAFFCVVLTFCINKASGHSRLSNSAFILHVTVKKSAVNVTLKEKQIPLKLSEGYYIYRAQVSGTMDTVFSLQDPAVTVNGQNMIIRGKLAGLDIEQIFYMPSDKP